MSTDPYDAASTGNGAPGLNGLRRSGGPVQAGCSSQMDGAFIDALMAMARLCNAWQHWHDLGRMKPGTVPAPVLEAHTAAMLNPLCAEVMRGGGVK